MKQRARNKAVVSLSCTTPWHGGNCLCLPSCGVRRPVDCNPAGTAASHRFAKRVKIPLSACSENMHCAEQLAALPAAAHLHSKTAFLHEKKALHRSKGRNKGCLPCTNRQRARNKAVVSLPCTTPWHGGNCLCLPSCGVRRPVVCNPAGTAASHRLAERVKILLSACSGNLHCAEQLAALPAAAHLYSDTAFLHEKKALH